MYAKILELAFLWQKTGKVEQMAKEGDEEIFEHVGDDQKEISPEEKKKMIATLEKQMWETSEAKEFERAARFRDRIRELQEERPLNEHSIEDDWGF
jgi:excinuclease UvrABC helicase subunit UvrB